MGIRGGGDPWVSRGAARPRRPAASRLYQMQRNGGLREALVEILQLPIEVVEAPPEFYGPAEPGRDLGVGREIPPAKALAAGRTPPGLTTAERVRRGAPRERDRDSRTAGIRRGTGRGRADTSRHAAQSRRASTREAAPGRNGDERD